MTSQIYQVDMDIHASNMLLYFRIKHHQLTTIKKDKNVESLIIEELAYDKTFMKNDCHQLLSSLTVEQRCVFDDIMTVVHEKKGGIFFVYGYGGTGKTFL